MDIEQHFELIGSCIHFPGSEIGAEEIDRRLGKPSGWTRADVGLNRRFECAVPQFIATMAAVVVAGAMEAAQVGWPELDLIVDLQRLAASAGSPQRGPRSSALRGRAQRIPCFDVQGDFVLGSLSPCTWPTGCCKRERIGDILVVCS